MLAQYNTVFPGCAERIVKMAESQSEHRQRLEKSVIESNIKAEQRGQIFAFILGAIAIVGGIGLIGLGKDVQGLVAIIGALGSLVGIFIWGRWRKEKERERNRQESDPQLPLPLSPPD